jgi:cold shock CspA family protein
MLWFNEAKHCGFILSDEGERLYVDRAGFVGGVAPIGRCAGLPVELRIEEREGKRTAVDVSLVQEEAPRRARRRSTSLRSSWS